MSSHHAGFIGVGKPVSRVRSHRRGQVSGGPVGQASQVLGMGGSLPPASFLMRRVFTGVY